MCSCRFSESLQELFYFHRMAAFLGKCAPLIDKITEIVTYLYTTKKYTKLVYRIHIPGTLHKAPLRRQWAAQQTTPGVFLQFP